jgi:hypothetical protein
MTDDRIGAAAETLLAELAAETEALAEAERSARRIRRRRRELGTSINNAECWARCLKRPGRRAWQDCRAASASM